MPRKAGRTMADGDPDDWKSAGPVFVHRQTTHNFMMRLRIPHAFLKNTTQLRTISDISRNFSKRFTNLTTQQQVQLHSFTINDVQKKVSNRLRAVGLIYATADQAWTTYEA